MSLYPHFERDYHGKLDAGLPVVWIASGPDGIVVTSDSQSTALPVGPELFSTNHALLLGVCRGRQYVACEIAGEPPAGYHSVELRKLFGHIPELDWFVAGYAAQVLHWRKTSGFCPVCGAQMGPMQKEWARRCTGCGHERYPQVSPAVLVLVHDGADRILMAHKPGWGNRYSILAGFVLPEESLEECVMREVAEEAGVEVTEIRYDGSQPWPYPHQLMIGFRARYVANEIRIDQEELDDARWFCADSLPELPGALSLSRQMIDRWAAEARR